MRSSFKFEVERDWSGEVVNRFAVLEVTLSKKDNEQMLWDFVEVLEKKFNESIGGEYDSEERKLMCTLWINRDDFYSFYIDAYKDAKKIYKEGYRVVKEDAEEVAEQEQKEEVKTSSNEAPQYITVGGELTDMTVQDLLNFGLEENNESLTTLHLNISCNNSNLVFIFN